MHASGYSDSAPQQRGVVASSVYAHGRKLDDIPIEEAGQWSKKQGHVVWIGLLEPDADLLARVQRQLTLHPMAIEDAEKAHQYPKIEQYGDSLFVVARTAQLTGGHIAFGETRVFVGRGYVVSVRHGASTSYARVREQCESCPAVLKHGEDYILYAILDFIVDNRRHRGNQRTPGPPGNLLVWFAERAAGRLDPRHALRSGQR